MQVNPNLSLVLSMLLDLRLNLSLPSLPKATMPVVIVEEMLIN
jgi:hypothetical protein